MQMVKCKLYFCVCYQVNYDNQDVPAVASYFFRTWIRNFLFFFPLFPKTRAHRKTVKSRFRERSRPRFCIKHTAPRAKIEGRSLQTRATHRENTTLWESSFMSTLRYCNCASESAAYSLKTHRGWILNSLWHTPQDDYRTFPIKSAQCVSNSLFNCSSLIHSTSWCF